MLIPRLLRTLLSFFAMGIVPDGGGGAAAPAAPEPDAPTVDSDTPTDEPAAAAPAADDDKPFDVSASLNKALDLVSEPAATPAAAATPTPPAAPAAGAPAATPAPTPAPKPAEPDLTPPEGMTDRAKARWDQLTDRVKAVPELERRATEAESQVANVRQMVASTGMDAAEFADTLETARLLKSGDPKDLEAALARIDQVRTDIAVRLGKDVPGADPLAAHPDLKAEVEGLSLTRERALEIARGRDATRRLQAGATEQNERTQYVQTVNAAATNIDQALAQREGTPGHDAKVAFVRQYLSDPKNQQALVNTYQPQQWPDVVLRIYDAHVPAAPAAPAPPQPLRPHNVRPGGQVRSGPVTAESAVSGALDRLGF